MQRILQKFISRKLWMALTGVVSGIALLRSGSITEGTTLLVSAILGYLTAEGIVDARQVQTIAQAQQAAEEKR